ncbi:MAG: aminotransferase class V-fold PLP-dependent enzyme [Methanomassiliicoccales archaeon]
MEVIYRGNHHRSLVVGLDTMVPLLRGGQQKVINFDNAATTPPLKAVVQAVNDFTPWYASINRGAGHKSQYSTHCYENTRNEVLKFVGGDPDTQTVIFVGNTTDAINKLAYRLRSCLDRRDVIISTGMEHHSNDLPWREKFLVDYVDIDQKGALSIDDLEQKLQHWQGRVRLVTVTGASNVTGIINPIHQIARLAHQYGAEIMVDGAQLVPHRSINMLPADDPEHLDYLAFSAHKMYAPFGLGVLVANSETFNCGCSEIVGGGTVETVTHDLVIWAPPPERDEAGTPNVFGTVALTAAINTLTRVGMDKLADEEMALASYARKKISLISGLTMYGYTATEAERVGIICFNLTGLPHELVATILALEYGIAVRNGCFCAQPYVQKLLNLNNKRDLNAMKNGMVRVSLGLYNTASEVDTLVAALKAIISAGPANKKRYQQNGSGGWAPL